MKPSPGATEPSRWRMARAARVRYRLAWPLEAAIDGRGAMDDETLMHALADAAGAAILPHFRSALAVESKRVDGYDPVTVADRAAEEAMRATIAAERPEDGVTGEEFPPVPSRSGRTWMLDPIDGTKAFVAGLPSWGTLIALCEDGTPRLGMMNQPFVGERFFTAGGAACWRRGGESRRLETRRGRGLADALLLATHPDMFEGAAADAFARLAARVRHVRYGTDCYGYAMVAAGQADLVVEASLKPFDIAPFVPLVEAAGGVVASWTGGPAAGGGAVIAAGDAALADAAATVLAG